MNLIKYSISIMLIALTGCSNKTSYLNKTPAINSYLISEYEYPEDYFINNYTSNKLKTYDKSQTKSVYDSLMSESVKYKDLNKNDVFNLLGIPALVKSSNVDEIWQYRSSVCILNIIWENKTNKINNFKSYTANLEDKDFKECFANFISLESSKNIEEK